ncbi:hypothetical protein [Serratia fonticola]|nr:hypothetical protein [Serratia fonticola]MBC3220067.1 hypothetical protein [Serratia fonticola]HEJ9059734.1 hypothetical protein [Serratia fonticola]
MKTTTMAVMIRHPLAGSPLQATPSIAALPDTPAYLNDLPTRQPHC